MVDALADLALVGGTVSTMDSARSCTDAVAIRAGCVQALGSARVREVTGPRTEVIDLRGRHLLPGFQDAHVHPVYGGLQSLRCDLSGSRDAADCLRHIGEYRFTHGERGWLLGGGWDMGHFAGGAPDRERLDAVTGQRPACLFSQDHHSAWVNTAALRIAGIDRHTPSPGDGWIEREPDGSPAGTLHEGAVDLVSRCLPRADDREYEDALLAGQRHLHAHGVTSWHDAIVGEYLGFADALPTYVELDRRGLLTGRASGALWWDRDRGVEQIEDLRERRARARGQRFHADTVKIMQDGVCENFTASLMLPYLGAHGSGLSFVDPSALARAVRLLDAEDFQVHFHAIGDRAIKDALDALGEAAESNGHRGLRHQIAHVQVVRPGDIPRFRTLGVVANIQPAWAIYDAPMVELTVPRLGHRRSEWQYPFRSLRGAGAVLAAGSDWPVSDVDPMRAIHAAVNRTDSADNGEPFMPEEGLQLTDALAAYTAGSAWVNHLDRDTGSLEIGKRADLVVLDRDPFELRPEEIGDTLVDLTFVDGRIVHSRGT
ncbi:amidohydrolase [Parasphingorhabdus pacifica]